MNAGDDGMAHLAAAAHDWCSHYSITSSSLSNSVCGDHLILLPDGLLLRTNTPR